MTARMQERILREHDIVGGDKGSPAPLTATPFTWREPSTIPPRPWLYGRHLLRKQVSVTVAPGGVGKSSLTIAEAVAMASGRELLDEWVAGRLRVWLYNLEDPRDELDRRIVATMLHYGVQPDDIGDRLFVDTGRERGLCTATHTTRAGTVIVRPEVAAIEAALRARRIDVMIVDPFVSSHRVPENDNGAVDVVAKEWARVSDRCGCAIELVHHTRKLNGEEGTTESGRGATALLAAARSGRVLNRMTEAERKAADITDSDISTYFSVTRDKANLAPMGGREWRRTVSVVLGQGDHVGVVERWTWPDAFAGLTVADLLAVQRAIAERCEAGKPPRASDQAADWAGHLVAAALGLDADGSRQRIKQLLKDWLKSGALRKGEHMGPQRKSVPTVEVGKWANE